jgi:hypothetical protein
LGLIDERLAHPSGGGSPITNLLHFVSADNLFNVLGHTGAKANCMTFDLSASVCELIINFVPFNKSPGCTIPVPDQKPPVYAETQARTRHEVLHFNRSPRYRRNLRQYLPLHPYLPSRKQKPNPCKSPKKHQLQSSFINLKNAYSNKVTDEMANKKKIIKTTFKFENENKSLLLRIEGCTR